MPIFFSSTIFSSSFDSATYIGCGLSVAERLYRNLGLIPAAFGRNCGYTSALYVATFGRSLKRRLVAWSRFNFCRCWQFGSYFIRKSGCFVRKMWTYVLYMYMHLPVWKQHLVNHALKPWKSTLFCFIYELYSEALKSSGLCSVTIMWKTMQCNEYLANNLIDDWCPEDVAIY